MRKKTVPSKPKDSPTAEPTETYQGMAIIRMPLADLMADPANVRLHDERNLSSIRASLVTYGQVKPIVISHNNVVIAGNGTMTAAASLGWEFIDCVRTGLTGAMAVAYGIADNRTAELATWDYEALPDILQGLRDDGLELGSVGFTEEELTGLFESREAEDNKKEKEEEDGGNDKLIEKWMIVIECKDENHQVELLDRFQEEGLTCRTIVS